MTGVQTCALPIWADIAYPKLNTSLYNEIAERGLIISEFPIGTPPRPGHFPRRNRIIAGLSLGCLVVEGALSSGSLITARFSADLGREVFALPGSIHSPHSKGCHALIKQGAALVESTNDILEQLNHLDTNDQASTRDASAVRQSRIHPVFPNPEILGIDHPLLQYIGYDPIDVDTLTERSGLTPGAVSAMLLELELDGRVGGLPRGRYQLLSK